MMLNAKSTLAPARHALQVPKVPKPTPVLIKTRARMLTRSEALSGSGVSQLAAKMEPFAGTNCYYLLVGHLLRNSSSAAAAVAGLQS
jgi:hypothetical protein